MVHARETVVGVDHGDQHVLVGQFRQPPTIISACSANTVATGHGAAGAVARLG